MPKTPPMNAKPTLLTAILLGGVAWSAPALADEPAIAVAADAEPQQASDTAPAAPAWEHRVPTSTKLETNADGQPIGDRTLRLVQRSTTGKVIAAQAAVSLFAGVIGGSGFRKDQLKGTRVDTVPNPAFSSMEQQARAALAAYFSAHPGAIPEQSRPVQVTVGDFTLIYKELGNAGTEYELRQNVDLGFPYRRKLPTMRLTGGEGAHCRIAEPVSASLEAWQADDYALARQTAERYAEACVASFAATLPTLFPDGTPAATAAPPPEAADAASAEVGQHA